jgi:hypothetical protein
MNRLERVAMWVLLTLGLCGCAHTLKQEAHVDIKEADREVVTTTTQTGPETITVTVEEFEALTAAPKEVMPSAPATVAPNGMHLPILRIPATRGAVTQPEHGPLVKRTVTVDQRAPATTETRVESRQAVELKAWAKDEESSRPAGFFAFLSAFWPLLPVGLVVVAGVVLWIMKPPFLGWLWKLLRRAP